MKRLQLENGLLRSRIAQRVFGLFVACATLPLILLAALSFFGVTRQLETQAKQELRQSVKATGMELVSRLSVVQSELESVLSLRYQTKDVPDPAGSPDAVSTPNAVDPPDPTDPTGLASARFHGVQVLNHAHATTWEWGQVPGTDLLTPEDWDRLTNGHSILRTIRTNGPRPGVAMFVPSQESPLRVVAATLNPAFLWNDEAVEAESDERQCFDSAGRVLFRASASGSFPYPDAIRAEGKTSEEFEWKSDGDTYLGASWTTFLKYMYDVEWTFAEARPKSVVMAPVKDFLFSFALVCGLTFLVVFLLSSTLIRKYLEPIRVLQAATARIANEDFGTPVKIETDDELAELGTSFNDMSAKLGSLLRARRSLLNFGITLSGESREDRILPIMLESATEIFRASGAFVFPVDNAGKPTSLGVKSNSQNAAPRILDPSGFDPGKLTPLAERFRTTKELAVVVSPEDSDLIAALSETRQSTQQLQGAICLPLRDHEDEFQGLLVILTRTEGHSASILAPDRMEVGALFCTMAGAALSQSRLVAGFKNLFDGMSQMIATAIDEKSPYTYEHCQRVPLITMMIADKASAATEGAMKGFTLNEEERYELEVAALLHDCGKVVTPVHVVDKATKLETIWDRIEMVGERVEILRRDMIIEALLAKDNQSDPVEPDLSRAEAEFAQLNQDLEFLKTSNRGGEFMSPELQNRVREIGERYRFETIDGETRSLLTENEIENLQISRGTLTGDEIQIIRNHASASIRMLEKLPYPRNLERVPLIAGAHHERMDGKGYPNGVQIGELPIQARILALADVFEALTAKDRPYKDGKTLSEVLKIMGHMTEGGHLDPLVFDFFVREGIFMEYANLKLSPEQIDDVDLQSIPGYEVQPEAANEPRIAA